MIGVCEKCGKTATVNAFDRDKGLLCECCASQWRKIWIKIESRYSRDTPMRERVRIWNRVFYKFIINANMGKEKVVFT